MDSDHRLVVRLSSETVAVLRSLVDSGEFRTLSDAVRSVLDDYAEERLSQGVIPLPELGEDVLSIEDLTIDGSSLDSAVCAAAKQFAQDKLARSRQWGM